MPAGGTAREGQALLGKESRNIGFVFTQFPLAGGEDLTVLFHNPSALAQIVVGQAVVLRRVQRQGQAGRSDDQRKSNEHDADGSV